MPRDVSIDCTTITEYCRVEDTIYGYYPSLGFNAFFVAFFALCAILQLYLGLRAKTYFFAVAVVMGCVGETIGYAGRIIMHSNPYSDLGFKMQIACLVFSPAFIAAAIYLTLKHIVLAFGEERSILKARYYTWIFITCDFISLMMQAAGGGIAASAGDDASFRNIGTDLMIAGIVFQVITLLVFATLTALYAVRTWRAWHLVSLGAKELYAQPKFKAFLAAMTLAFATSFTRCVYRIAEMVGGWANPIMRDEPSFIALEGFMIVIAVLAMTVFHPGLCFPHLAKRGKKERLTSLDGNVESGEAIEKVSS